MLCGLVALQAVPCFAQISVPAQAPPGTVMADMATWVGWVRWGFGFVAVVLFIVALVSIIKHPASGIIEFVACLVCILLAANASTLVNALYHGGVG